MYTALARALLLGYGGYECKEPEPGKFTLAFRWAARGGVGSSPLHATYNTGRKT